MALVRCCQQRAAVPAEGYARRCGRCRPVAATLCTCAAIVWPLRRRCKRRRARRTPERGRPPPLRPPPPGAPKPFTEQLSCGHRRPNHEYEMEPRRTSLRAGSAMTSSRKALSPMARDTANTPMTRRCTTAPPAALIRSASASSCAL
eukprot:scaffold6036_cov371-Prasinococcus_capsulatus_cf.AAC.12